MHRRMPLVPLLVLLVVSFLVAGVAPAAATQDPTSKILRMNWGEVPETLDPQLSHEGQWAISGGLDFEGLTRSTRNCRSSPARPSPGSSAPMA